MPWPVLAKTLGKAVIGGLTSGLSSGISARIGAQIAGRHGDPGFGFGGPQVFDQLMTREWMAGQERESRAQAGTAQREAELRQIAAERRQHEYRMAELREQYRGETQLRMLMNPLDWAQLSNILAEQASRLKPTIPPWVLPRGGRDPEAFGLGDLYGQGLLNYADVMRSPGPGYRGRGRFGAPLR